MLFYFILLTYPAIKCKKNVHFDAVQIIECAWCMMSFDLYFGRFSFLLAIGVQMQSLVSLVADQELPLCFTLEL